MSSLFDWFKDASKGSGDKNTDQKPVKERSSFSRSILSLMKQKSPSGYYTTTKPDIQSGPNDSKNKPKP